MSEALLVDVDIVELFAGPGGWDEGARMAGVGGTIEGIEIGRDAVATARAAGHRRRHCDVLAVDPVEYWSVTGLIGSPPCPTFSAAGLGSGRGVDYQHVLDVWSAIGWGVDADEAIATLPPLVEDPRTALLATVGVWALALPGLRWVALEQVPAVAFAWEDLAAELYAAGWEWVDVLRIDAVDCGAASRRDRVYLVASRYAPAEVRPERVAGPSMADALGWPAGHEIVTRGNRRPTGGNRFSADGPSWCLTGRARSWVRDDGERLTPAEAGVLSGFRPDYPWQGSRTAQFQQAGDVVSPIVAASLLGGLAASAGAVRAREAVAA